MQGIEHDPSTRATRRIREVIGGGSISADDAARWAHRMIDKYRKAAAGDDPELDFGGVILKRGPLYFPTLPMAGESRRRLLDKDADGHFIAPGDYTVVAFYSSHPADVAAIQGRFPSFTADQAMLFNSFYSAQEQRFIFANRTFSNTHYLSGPDNLLLKYVSSGSAIEDTLEQHLSDATLKDGDDIENAVQRLAEAGELSVLLPSLVWGGVRGPVAKTWQINTPVTNEPAEKEQPSYSGALPWPENLVDGLLSSPDVQNEAGRIGFVLKHISAPIYVATLPQPKTEPLFSPDAVFTKNPDGTLHLPADYRLEGIYFSSWNEADEKAARETWLAETFFTPAQVVAAARQLQTTRAIQDAEQGLSLYMLAADSAVLKIKVPQASPANPLVRENSQGELDDNGAQAALASGTLSPREFMRRVLAVTELSVLKRGYLWIKEGVVDNDGVLLTPHVPTLSRSFLSARDAAIHAHELIGNRRDRSYGGYVLKGRDGRFRVTEPMEGTAWPFAGSLFFPGRDYRPLIAPDFYVLHGRYGSHAAGAKVDAQVAGQLAWTPQEQMLVEQMFSCDSREMYSIIRNGQVAYLSAAEDCLLEYAPNHCPEEQALFAVLEPRSDDNIDRKLNSGEIRPLEWVVRLAAMGSLSILQGNRFWGPRSLVRADWAPNGPYAETLRPATFGAVFASADEAAGDLHQRLSGRTRAEQACFAFLLKHKNTEEYIATEVVGGTELHRLFALSTLFDRVIPQARDLRYPADFELYGLFRSQRGMPQGLNTSSAWLTQFFVTPDVLYIALRKALLTSGRQILPVYFSNLDGALLRYAPKRIEARRPGTASQVLELARQALDAGQKTPWAFVMDWAARGQLQVLSISQCWSTPGLVDPTSAAYASETARHAHLCFASADDAARHATGLPDREMPRGYGGLILKLANGLFTSTAALAFAPLSDAVDWVHPDEQVELGFYPGGSTVVARYRTLTEAPAPAQLTGTQKAIYESMIPSVVMSKLLHRDEPIECDYVFGVDGLILRYRRSKSADELLLKERLAAADPVNAVEQQIRSGALSPQAFVTEIAKVGELCVVQGNTLWGPARQITLEFVPDQYRPGAAEIRQATYNPPCSPVFAQAFDAVRHAQGVASAQADVAFGYVFKATDKPLYMATLALVRQDFADLHQVFVNAQLPERYGLQGLYLRASNVAMAATDDALARSFFPPQHLIKALNFCTAARSGNVLPLYLLCDDGAVLEYLLTDTPALLDWTTKAHQDRGHLLAGSLNVLDYVRRLAGAGALVIKVTSQVWQPAGRVTAQWQLAPATVEPPQVVAIDAR